MPSKQSRREFMRKTTGVLAAGMAGAGLFLRAAHAARPKPNVIFILADDMGSADAGFNGCKDIPTPHLDSLAGTGVRCTNGYVSHPFCSPTRAGILTGRYQQRFGHENNPVYDPRDEKAGLPAGEVTLPQALKQAGYTSGIVGKWHLGAAPCFHPMKRGFDEMFGFLGGGHDYFQQQMEGEAREYLVPLQRDGKLVAEPEYLTDALSREAAAFVRRHKDDPFFLYLAYNAPHGPLQATEKYLNRFAHIEDQKRRRYAAMLSSLDDGVGLLLSTLSELKLDNDTLIFFLSDNGGPIADHSNGSRNDPLTSGKGSLFEGGIRVPFVVRWRGRLPEGKDFDHPVISMDLFQSALAAAGAQAPADRKMDGANLLPHLRGENPAPPHERLFWRTGGGTAYAVREGRYKFIKAGQRQPALFDLQTDIGESKNLAPAHPDIMDRLLKAYEEWNKELIPPLFQSPKVAPKKPPPRKQNEPAKP